MLQAPFDSLDFLKNTLLPQRGVDLLNLPLDEYERIVDRFRNLFEKFDDLKIDQIEATYLYMAFSHFIHHWAADPIVPKVNIAEKLNMVKALDRQAYPFIGKCIKNINNTYTGHYQGWAKYYHQTILMINGNLFAFVHNLAKSGQFKIDEFLDKMVFSVRGDLLEISQNKAQQRENGAMSFAEEIAYHALTEQLAGATFMPLKTKKKAYIDKLSGLELDFPLEHQITIETDGARFHTVGGVHDLVHNFKSYLLRELGWVRVGMVANQQITEHAKMTASFLKIDQVVEFHLQYRELITLLNNIRSRIIDLQQKNNLKPQFKLLFELESELRSFVERRNLDKLLSSGTKEKSILETYSQYLTAVQFKQRLDSERSQAVATLEDLQAKKCAEEQLEQALTIVEGKIQQAQDNIERLQRGEIKLNPGSADPRAYLKVKEAERQEIVSTIESRKRSESYISYDLEIERTNQGIAFCDRLISSKNTEMLALQSKVQGELEERLPLTEMTALITKVKNELALADEKPFLPQYEQQRTRIRKDHRYRDEPYMTREAAPFTDRCRSDRY